MELRHTKARTGTVSQRMSDSMTILFLILQIWDHITRPRQFYGTNGFGHAHVIGRMVLATFGYQAHTDWLTAQTEANQIGPII